MTPHISTTRLTLRPMHRDDAPAVTDLIGDLDVARWLTLVPHPYALSDAFEFMDALHEGAPVWAITIGGPLIGVISIKTELGYWLGKPFWGQGIMSEAASAVVAAYFATSTETLRSGYHLGNAGSANVLRKLGFGADGTRIAFSKARQQDVTIQEMTLPYSTWRAGA